MVVVKAHYEHCSTSPACAVLTESRDQDCIKVIADYAGLSSTSEKAKVLAPIKFELQTRPEVQQIICSHGCFALGVMIPDSALALTESSMIIGLTIGYQLYQPK